MRNILLLMLFGLVPELVSGACYAQPLAISCSFPNDNDITFTIDLNSQKVNQVSPIISVDDRDIIWDMGNIFVLDRYTLEIRGYLDHDFTT